LGAIVHRHPPIQIAANTRACPSLASDMLSQTSAPEDSTTLPLSKPAELQSTTASSLLLDQRYLENLFRHCEAVHLSYHPPPPPTLPARDETRDQRSLRERLRNGLRTKRGSTRRLPEAIFPHVVDNRSPFEVLWRDFHEALSRRVLVRSYREHVANLRDDDASNMLNSLQTVWHTFALAMISST
jgi:hypothetical protein